MLAFGLSRKLCNDFLKKQAVIGNLDEGERQPGAGRAGPGRRGRDQHCVGQNFPCSKDRPCSDDKCDVKLSG